MKTSIPLKKIFMRLVKTTLPAACIAALLGGLLPSATAADVTWTGGAAGTSGTWLTADNWSPPGVPTVSDNAIFDSAGTATTITIQMATAGGLQRVGAITLAAGNMANRGIRNNSGNTRGTLELNGVAGLLLANYSMAQLTLSNAYGTSLPMEVRLASSGEIHVANDGSFAQIVIGSTITEANGSQGFTKTGPGILYLMGTNNSFTGPITNSAGAIKVNANGSFGDGTAPVYLTGGNIISGATRSTPLPNPIVLMADSFIYNDGGTPGSARVLPFSGPFSGDVGSLTFANLTTSLDQTFRPQLSGAFTFNRPMVVGTSFDTAGSFTELQLFNSGTDGLQVFNGNISGQGRIWRSGSGSAPPGTTVFTGDNTYEGGTRISYGTILANNSSGSALGYGPVVVTNQGTLGGNGTATTMSSAEVSLGGTVSPGASEAGIANLNINQLTLGESAHYIWHVTAATGTAGTDWDLITCTSGWVDTASALNPITLKVDTLGSVPTGWNPSVARAWTLIQSGSAMGFDPSHFLIDTTAFVGSVQGVFSVSVVSGSLQLNYTPAPDLVINVPTGTQTQGQAGYPLLTGTYGVIKIGEGEAVFDNPLNNYAGSTRIYAGTASLTVDALNNSGAFGAANTAILLGNTTGNSNATLNISVPGVTHGRGIVVQSGSTGVKTIGTTVTSGVVNYTGDITLQDNVVLGAPASGETAISGTISGDGGVTKAGAGTVTLAVANTYSGDTTVNAGTLQLGGRPGSGTFTIAGPATLDNISGASFTCINTAHVWSADFTFTGTSSLNLGTGPVTVSGQRALNIVNNTLTVGGAISGNGGLTKNGTGTLSLTSSGNDYNGDTTVSAGLLSISSSATLGDGSGTLQLAGGTLGLTGSRGTAGVLYNSIHMTADSIIQNSTGAGSGTRYLPFGGGLTASGGTLTIRNVSTANTNVMNVRFYGGGINFSRPIVFDNSLAGSSIYNTARIGLHNTNGTPDQVFSGPISGPGSIARGAPTGSEGGRAILSGANTFTLGIELAGGGELGLGSETVMAGSDIVSSPFGSGMLEWTGNGSLFAHDAARTLANYVYLNGMRYGGITGSNALTFTGVMNIGTVAKGFRVENTATTTFAGVLTNSASLTKGGPGVLALTAANENTGGWIVTNGTLLVNNTTGSGTGSGNVTVTGDGILGGTGTIAGAVSGDGRIAPGESAGILTLGSGLDLSPGGTLVWELAANSTTDPGVNFDVLALTGGDLVLGGASKLAIQFTGSATAPDASNPFWQASRSWTIVSLGGAAANPSLTNFSEIFNGTSSAGSFTNYADATGNVILEFIPGAGVPEPVIDSAITGAGTANATLSWSAVNGVTYQVQYKTNLNQPGWLILGSETATGSTASFTDTTGPHAERYYRVIVP